MKLRNVAAIFIWCLGLLACSRHSQEESQLIGSIASAHPLATKAGMDILKKGGNAFDAAIAVASTLNVVEPMMSGLGGYGTILIYDANAKQTRFLNPSGRFPVATNTDLMRSPTPGYEENRIGPKSISTPGNLNAWGLMHKQYGKLEWPMLFESAIENAEKGFPLTALQAYLVSLAFEEFSPYSKSFYGNGEGPLKEGEQLIQSDLAKTYRLIANEGVDVFYSGEIAVAIASQMKSAESFLALEDLKNNEAEWWDPITYDYKGYEVYTASLPANSFAAFVNLGLMEQFAEKEFKHNSPAYLHLFAEMTKESYKARLAYSFDPEVKKAPLDSLLSESVLSAWASALNLDKASEFEPPFSHESRNTTHFVVVDKWGNVVSATQTLGNLFGSRVMVEGTGIWMNNSMAYSTFEPKGNPMDAFAGRHKLSGDCPIIIIKDGEPWAALGSPGGHTITQNVPQIIFNLIDFGMNMQQAIDAPKISFVEPNSIVADRDLPDTIVDSLIARGHQVRKGRIGNAQGIKLVRSSDGSIIGYEVGIDNRGEGNGPAAFEQ